nr:40S ribosomal protein S13 [Ipomoea batatas]
MPSNAGEPLDGQGTESSQHGPPAMNELTFPEPLDPEHLTVRLKRSRLNVGALYPGPNDVSGHILGQILVQRVQLKLQVLSGLRQPERVEPNVTHQASVQPFRRLRSGEPRCVDHVGRGIVSVGSRSSQAIRGLWWRSLIFYFIWFVENVLLELDGLLNGHVGYDDVSSPSSVYTGLPYESPYLCFELRKQRTLGFVSAYPVGIEVCRASATFATMGRMHSRSKGISSSALPYKRTPPNWLKISSGDVEDNICKFTKRDMTPSQIGVILRDSHGIAQVKSVIGSKILRILKAHGFAPEIPEDLYHLIKKVVAIRKHLERNRKDKDSKFR